MAEEAMEDSSGRDVGDEEVADDELQADETCTTDNECTTDDECDTEDEEATEDESEADNSNHSCGSCGDVEDTSQASQGSNGMSGGQIFRGVFAAHLELDSEDEIASSLCGGFGSDSMGSDVESDDSAEIVASIPRRRFGYDA
ncbi:hypothetical protein FA13DRAFT_1791235 [Coprinellus micaceus]|uniref:Uncharacterized protein n=1 Tax=Coprinellus micaceus TaxID=71717 RepID=A0A4Y7TD58_COPMI|nr:hypothetical protein FA13DRAFT_1791235 [Coprinellus micaceus]